MAAVPLPFSPQKSTNVRKKNGWPAGLRLAFAAGSWLAPGPTLRRATRLFETPSAAARERARTAADGGARIDAVVCDGRRLAMYAWGDPARQPTVLFVHGWSSYGLRCLPWVEPLRRAGYATVAFDQVAHGRSGDGDATLPAFAAATAAVAARCGGIACVIGHSMGGAAATLALARGLRADRALLIAPAADLYAAGQRFGRRIGLADRLVARMFQRFEARIGVRVSELTPHALAPALGVPALVVHDGEDREVPWDEGERYARYWPGARLLTTAGLGHHRILTDDATIAAGLAFLRGVPVGTRVVSSQALPYGLA